MLRREKMNKMMKVVVDGLIGGIGLVILTGATSTNPGHCGVEKIRAFPPDVSRCYTVTDGFPYIYIYMYGAMF